MSKDTVSLRDIQSAITDLRKELLEPIRDHEVRIRSTEAFQNRVYGIALLFATVPSVVISYIVNSIIDKK
jgi:hypothetical protein